MSVFVVPAESVNHIKSVHSIGERTKPRSKSNVPPIDIDFIGASIDNLLFLHRDWQTGPSFGWNIREFYLAVSGESLLVGFKRFWSSWGGWCSSLACRGCSFLAFRGISTNWLASLGPRPQELNQRGATEGTRGDITCCSLLCKTTFSSRQHCLKFY